MKRDTKTALVSGGAGFIGSFLCDALIDKGYEVYCIDNLITGSHDNIKHLKGERFHFIHHDVIKPLDPAVSNKISAIDFVYHLASPASPPKYQRYWLETLMVNSVGTYQLLELAKNYKSRFLYTSTSEVYGDPLIHPQKENYYGNVNPVGLRSCYDEGKRFGEALTMAYFRNYKLNTRIIRIFNTYGPRMDPRDGRVIVNFINQAINGRSLTVYGDGKQTRSFCYISDMVEGLLLSMEKDATYGQVLNLGYPKEYKVSEIALLVKKHIGSQSKIIYAPKSEDDPQRRKPDIGYAKKLLGWYPRITLSQGLGKTIEYFLQKN